MTDSLKRQYEALIAAGHLEPVDDRAVPRMPEFYICVPTFKTYGTGPAVPAGEGRAELERNPKRDQECGVERK